MSNVAWSRVLKVSGAWLLPVLFVAGLVAR